MSGTVNDLRMKVEMARIALAAAEEELQAHNAARIAEAEFVAECSYNASKLRVTKARHGETMFQFAGRNSALNVWLEDEEVVLLLAWFARHRATRAG